MLMLHSLLCYSMPVGVVRKPVGVVCKGGKWPTADDAEHCWTDEMVEAHEHKMLGLADPRRKGPQRGLLNIMKAFGGTDAAGVIDSVSGMLLVKVEIDDYTAQENKEAACRFVKRMEAPYATWAMATIHTMYERFKKDEAWRITCKLEKLQKQQQQLQQPSASSSSSSRPARTVKKKQSRPARTVKKKQSAAASPPAQPNEPVADAIDVSSSSSD